MAASYPIECKVCHEHYDLEHRRPRSLPCGHPFCSACITNMINVGELTCPICCTKHKATIPTQFPINYGMEEIIGSFENIKITMPTSAQPDQGCLGGIGKKLQSLIQEQQNSLSNLSALNQDMVHQLGVYEAQLLEWQSDHYQLLTVLNDSAELLQKELSSVQTLKKNGEEQEKQQQSMLKHVTSVTTAQEALIALEETELCNTEVESWVQKCRNLFPNVGIIRSSMKVNEILRKTLEFFNEEESSSTVCQSDLKSPVVHGEDSSTTIIEKMKQVTSVSVKKSRHVNSEVRDLSSSGNVYAVRKKSDGNCTYYRMAREKGKVHLFSQEKRLPLGFHTVQLCGKGEPAVWG
nr:E3 ubiquitin-protein ligase TRIM22-like isoform X2 [Procambarus clarkii]